MSAGDGSGETLPPPSLPEWELWGCAHAALTRYRERTALFVAERIGELALGGDADGVAAWVAIAARIDRLRKGERPEFD